MNRNLKYTSLVNILWLSKLIFYDQLEEFYMRNEFKYGHIIPVFIFFSNLFFLCFTKFLIHQ